MEYKKIMKKYGVYRSIRKMRWQKQIKKTRMQYLYYKMRWMIMTCNCNSRKKRKMLKYLKQLL